MRVELDIDRVVVGGSGVSFHFEEVESLQSDASRDVFVVGCRESAVFKKSAPIKKPDIEVTIAKVVFHCDEKERVGRNDDLEPVNVVVTDSEPFKPAFLDPEAVIP